MILLEVSLSFGKMSSAKLEMLSKPNFDISEKIVKKSTKKVKFGGFEIT